MNADDTGPIATHLFTTRDACDYLNVSRPTLYRWARAVRLKRVKRGGVVRWPSWTG